MGESASDVCSIASCCKAVLAFTIGPIFIISAMFGTDIEYSDCSKLGQDIGDVTSAEATQTCNVDLKGIRFNDTSCSGIF